MRFRRHTSTGVSLPSLVPSHRLLRDGGLLLLTFAVGYAISALWISPTSLLGGGDHPVPGVIGLPVSEAQTRLTDQGFRARIEGERNSPAAARGAVIWQDPPAGMVLTPNTVVQLVVSSGPAPVTVPDVIGLALSSAERILTAAGIKIGTVDTVRAGGEVGIVIATRPGAGNGRPRGGSVDIVVSGGAGGGL
ncbi:MAG TPA: PASTA domain-containing protein [Gemmatimonadales bacterium]|jgi:beta-lactam-binding protein with PASTA domain